MKIKLVQGDITKQTVAAVVNAANSSLLGGGGVDGAIHRAGGPQILGECMQVRNRQGGCKVGEAVMTNAGDLPAEKVIHTVGPRIHDKVTPQKEEKLRDCYVNSLRLADKNELKSVAFPNISTGIYRFPKRRAAEIAVSAVRNFAAVHIEEVIFVCFDEENYRIYKELGVET